MTPDAAQVAQPAQISLIAGPELWRLDLEREDGVPDQLIPADGAGTLSFKVGFNRTSRERLGVEFSVVVEGLPALRLTATYRVVLEASPASLDDDEIELAMRQIGLRVAPTLVFPFARETLASVVQKAGLPALVLPLVNFSKVFDSEATHIPSYAASP
jgi:hypothetical protein